MTVYAAPLGEIAREFQTGYRSPREYVDELLERTEAVEPDIRALVAEPDREGRLRREAEALPERFPAWDRPPLYGVPVGVKDIFHVEGLPTRAGSDVPPEALAGPQATVVSTLKQAGALVFSKTVTTEFAYLEPGPTRNPHDLKRTPGGSSSGSAAAVAAGMCPLAFGSQTIGSTIRPAAFCGIVGFKPSYGRIPLDGVLPLAESVDHVGLFTQDVAGMRRAVAVTCSTWDAANPDTPVLGVPEGPYLEQTSEAGLTEFQHHVAALSDAGYEIRHVKALDDVETINDRHGDLVAAEAALAHQEWYERYGDRYSRETAKLIENGRDVDVGRLAEGRASRRSVRERLTDRMDEHGIDIWVSPATLGPAPEGIDSTGDPVMNLPWTHAGLPTVTLPASDIDGLPLGLQCTARFGSDERLLEWSEGLADVL